MARAKDLDKKRVKMNELDTFIEKYHAADAEFVRGNPEPYKTNFSHRDDATLANPFGSVARGWEEIVGTLERAASYYREGEILGYERRAKYADGSWKVVHRHADPITTKRPAESLVDR
jgi:hypothetical protein